MRSALACMLNSAEATPVLANCYSEQLHWEDIDLGRCVLTMILSRSDILRQK